MRLGLPEIVEFLVVQDYALLAGGLFGVVFALAVRSAPVVGGVRVVRALFKLVGFYLLEGFL